MTENTQQQPIQLQINSQYIKDLSFEAPNLPFVLLEMKSAPLITIDVDVQAQKTNTPDSFIVELKTKINVQRQEDKKAIFICELIYGGLVGITAPPEHIQPILLVEVPHLLFPYARAILANITRESGLPPLQINPIDFAGLYRSKLAAVAQEPEKKDA
ncbi:MAG: protein-export chaperone SecB [Alphaproteobacteria bacterium]|nr:protein-export chaperone SecB [Alphaproteobacteria bacterium]